MNEGSLLTGKISWDYVVKSSARVPMSQNLNLCITSVVPDARSTAQRKLRIILLIIVAMFNLSSM